MSETHDNNLDINISLQPTPPSQLGFGRALLIAEKANNNSGVTVKAYDDVDSVETDWTTTEKEAAATYFSQDPQPDKILIGEWDKVGNETLDTALDNILAEDDSFYGVTTASRTASEQETLSSHIESLTDQYLVYVLQSSEDDIVTASDLTSTNFGTNIDTRERTFIDYHTTDGEWMDLGHLGRILPYDQDDTSPPWYADVSGVANNASLPAGADIGTAESPGKLRGNNANIGLPFGSAPFWIAPGTNAAGRQGKVVVTRDWFHNRLQNKVALDIQTRRAPGEAIPVGEAGETKTAGQVAMAKHVKRQYAEGVRGGHFLPGQLNISYPQVTSADVAAGAVPLDIDMTVLIGAQAVSFNISFSRDPVN